MNKKRFFLIITFTFLMMSTALAKDVLTNETVVQMVELGLNDEVVISKITNSTCYFDTSTEALLDLKKKKVPTDIIKAMIEKSSTSAAKPKSLIPEGEFFYKKGEEYKEMVSVRVASAVSNRKRWIPFAGPFLNSEIFLFIAGEKATLRLSEKKPVFYTRIEPSFIKLVFLGYHRDKEKRYVVYEDDYSDREIQIDSEILDDKVYKIIPAKELAHGEYAYLVGNTNSVSSAGFVVMFGGSNTKAYDFGITE